MLRVRRLRRERARRFGRKFNSLAAALIRSRVACEIDRPGTSFRTTETVAGCSPKCSASFFKPVVLVRARCFPGTLESFIAQNLKNITIFFSSHGVNRLSSQARNEIGAGHATRSGDEKF